MPKPQHVSAVATNPIIAELVAFIGGPNVAVTSLIAQGEPVAAFQRSGPMEARLLTSDVIVTLGLGFDDGLAPSLKRAADEGIPIVEIGTSLTAERLLPSATGAQNPDYHVWMDPLLWQEAAEPIATALAVASPGDASNIETRRNSARFNQRELARKLVTLAELLPPDRRHIVTRNAGLRYLGRAVGFRVDVGDAAIKTENGKLLESLSLDTLARAGTMKIGRTESVDLGTQEGLVKYALDLMFLIAQ